MFQGMADKPERDHKREIEDWMHGSGGIVFAVAGLLLAGWFIYSLFW